MRRPRDVARRPPAAPGRLGALVAGAALAIGCGDAAGVRIAPVIESPAAGSDGDPWPGLTDVDLSVTRAADGVVVQSASAAVGEPLGLADLAFGTELVLRLSGRAREVEVAYGTSCPFAVEPDAAPPEPRLYFARIVTWSAGPAPAAPGRSDGAAYPTADGRAVFVGGGAPIERFDPQDGAFHPLDLPVTPRERAVVVGLADGRGLITGGLDATGDGVPTLELIDPAPGAPAGAALASQDGPRLVDHTATALVDGDVLAAGGREQLAARAPFAVSRQAYLIHFGDGGALEPPRRLAEQLAIGRAGATATRLGDEVGADVLIIGGQADSGLAVAETELYRPRRGRFETVDGALLDQPRWGHAAVRLPGGFVLVIGGLAAPLVPGGAPQPVDTLELYDPVQGRFAVAGRLPPRAGVIGESVTPLPDGRVLLAGGLAIDGQPVDTVLIAAFDPLSSQITLSPTDRMAAPRAGHAAARLCDGSVLVVGGAGEPGAPGSERYDPPAAGR